MAWSKSVGIHLHRGFLYGVGHVSYVEGTLCTIFLDGQTMTFYTSHGLCSFHESGLWTPRFPGSWPWRLLKVQGSTRGLNGGHLPNPGTKVWRVGGVAEWYLGRQLMGRTIASCDDAEFLVVGSLSHDPTQKRVVNCEVSDLAKFRGTSPVQPLPADRSMEWRIELCRRWNTLSVVGPSFEGDGSPGMAWTKFAPLV